MFRFWVAGIVTFLIAEAGVAGIAAGISFDDSDTMEEFWPNFFVINCVIFAIAAVIGIVFGCFSIWEWAFNQ